MVTTTSPVMAAFSLALNTEKDARKKEEVFPVRAALGVRLALAIRARLKPLMDRYCTGISKEYQAGDRALGWPMSLDQLQKAPAPRHRP